MNADVDGATIGGLITAVRAGDVEQVRRVLQLRPELVNVSDPANHGYTALHYAVLGRMPDMVRALMKLGADPHYSIYPHTDATNPLTIATEREYTELAAIIREEEKRREEGRPTVAEVPLDLRHALQAGDEDLAIGLLKLHPNLVQFCAPGNRSTFLHLASAMLLPRVAEWLLDHGADVNGQTDDGATPLDLVGTRCSGSEKAERATAMTALLRKRGAELTARSAVILGDVELLKKKHAEGGLVTPQDERGWLLRLAVDNDRPDLLRLLLDYGLDPDAKVQVGGEDEIVFTWGMPLYQCTRYGKHEMAEILLGHGADPNGQVYASGTPLSEAYGQQDERMIALLERHGGQSNASMAGLYRRPDLARRLLEQFGDVSLPDDGFSKGPVAEQLLGAAARGGDPEVLRLAMERVQIPHGDARWNNLLPGPLGFWNHWIGPWCHPEWDRGTYLTCFNMILERCGPPNGRLRHGTTILHGIVTMGDHVMAEERLTFATAALNAGARMDPRDDLLRSTPLGWACRWGRENLVQLFLERGADPNEADTEPWARPLAWAEKKGHQEIAAMLRRLTPMRRDPVPDR